MLARISSHELAEWQAYEQETGPLGPERDDFHAALVAYTVASGLSPGKTRLRLADFLPRWGKPRRQTADEQLAVFKALRARQKGARVDNR